MSSKSSRSTAAKKATAPAPADKAAETTPETPTETPAETAPDTTAPEAEATTPDAPADAPADETVTSDAPAEEKAAEEDAEAPAEPVAPADETPADETPADEAPAAPAPSSAPLDAPEAPEADEDNEQESTLLTDAGAQRLAARPAETVTDENGNPVDPETLFTEPGPDGMVVATVRLSQHSIGLYGRKRETLLIAAGQPISPAGAELIKAQIRAENA